MKVRNALVLACAAALIAMAGCASGPALPRPEAGLQYLDAYIRSQMAEKGITGLSIGMVDGDRVVLQKGYGTADKAKNIPVTEDTIFALGSVSKLFTNAGIMKLVERREVDLDAPLSRYIPEFSMKTRGSSLDGITIRNLLTHHSGIPSDYMKGFTSGDVVTGNHDTQFRDLVTALKGLYVATPPGTVFSYSNIGYSLLGIVIERVSGKDFTRFMEDEVLSPLGMVSSSFSFRDELAPRRAKGCLNGKEIGIPVIRDVPAGQLMSTARDMSLFLRAVISSAGGSAGLLGPDTISEVLRVQNQGVPLDFDFRIGLTWWVVPMEELPGVRLVGHGGDIPPFSSLLMVAPEKGIGVEINVSSVNGMGSMELRGIAVQVLRILLLLKEGADPFRAASEGGAAAVPQSLGESLQGYYSCPFGLVRATFESGRLYFEMMGMKFDADYYENGAVSLRYNLLGFIPIDIPMLRGMRFHFHEYGGKPWIVAKMYGITLGLAEKLQPITLPAEWAKRLGKYRIENPDSYPFFSDFELTYDAGSGFMLLKMKQLGSPGTMVVKPISDNELVTYGTGRGMNETMTFEKSGDGEVWSCMGFHLRKM